MQVSVSALAYEGAQVTASVGGQTIQLTETEDDTDEAERDSGYRLYVGVFTAPSASATATSMGNITFTATAQGETQTMQGASVTVNKLAVMGDGAVVYVTADQAETFPTDTLNDNSNPNYFPLPQGTVDKTYGDEIVYKNGSVTKTYWKLESGVRVYSSDIKASGGAMPDQNVISDMRIKTSGSYTTVTLDMTQKVPYKVEYDGSRLIVSQGSGENPPSAGDHRPPPHRLHGDRRPGLFPQCSGWVHLHHHLSDVPGERGGAGPVHCRAAALRHPFGHPHVP